MDVPLATLALALSDYVIRAPENAITKRFSSYVFYCFMQL